MKMSIYYFSLIVYLVHAIVAGSNLESKSETIAPAENNSPHVIDITKYTSEDFLTELRSLGNVRMNNILDDHSNLFENKVIAKLLHGVIIRHCISFTFAKNFTSELVDLMKTAIKSRMLISKARIEKTDAGRTEIKVLKETNDLINWRLYKSIDGEKLQEIMLYESGYIVHQQVKEYIIISLCNSRIANFLTKLFILMEKDRSFFITKLVSITQVDQQPRMKKQDESTYHENHENTKNFMTYFQGMNSVVDKYLSIPPKDNQQIAFQNELIGNHCKQIRLIDSLSLEAKEILKLAQDVKLTDFANRLEIFLSKVFEYKVTSRFPLPSITVIDGKVNLEPLSVADFSSDITFSVIIESDKYNSLSEENRKKIDSVLSEWIQEKIVISYIDQKIYEPLNEIFNLIDSQPDKSKKAVDAILAILKT